MNDIKSKIRINLEMRSYCNKNFKSDKKYIKFLQNYPSMEKLAHSSPNLDVVTDAIYSAKLKGLWIIRVDWGSHVEFFNNGGLLIGTTNLESTKTLTEIRNQKPSKSLVSNAQLKSRMNRNVKTYRGVRYD